MLTNPYNEASRIYMNPRLQLLITIISFSLTYLTYLVTLMIETPER